MRRYKKFNRAHVADTAFNLSLCKMKAVLGFAITHAAWSYLLDAVGAEGIQNSGQGESSFTPGAPRWGPGSCVTCCSSTKGRGFWALPTPTPHRGKSGSLGASGPLAHPRPPLRGSPPAPALRQVPRGQVLETHAPTPTQSCGEGEICPTERFDPGLRNQRAWRCPRRRC